MRYDFNKSRFGICGITFPEKKRNDVYSIIEELDRECQLVGIQFNRLRMQINDRECNKLAVLRNIGTRLEYTDFINNRKGYINKIEEVKKFVIEIRNK